MLSIHETFLSMALILAQRSHCVRKKVCALAVKDQRILASGINGTPPGFINCDQIYTDDNIAHGMFECNGRQILNDHHSFSEKYEIHAEMNMIIFAAVRGIKLEGCTVYTTVQPCRNCLKHLSMLKIKNIYFYEPYDKFTDLDQQEITQFCEKINLNLYKLEIDKNQIQKIFI